MQIFIYQYQRTSVLAPATLTGSQFICLPVPANLMDATHVTYTEKENSALVGAGFDLLSGNHQHSGQAAWGVQLASALGAKGIVGGLNTLLTGAGTAGETLLGVAGNPFLQVQFQSPEFKQHTFTWVFSPNSADESATLTAIINLLRFNMLPNLLAGGAGVFLGYPAVFLPMIVPNGPSELYVFKRCVLDSVQVHYAPTGVPVFLTGTQAPATVSLTLHFLSIEIDLQDTYGQSFGVGGAGAVPSLAGG